MIFLMETDGTIFYSSAGFDREFSKLWRKKGRKRNIRDLAHKDGQNWSSILDTLKQGRELQLELSAVAADGSFNSLLLKPQPSTDEVESILGIITRVQTGVGENIRYSYDIYTSLLALLPDAVMIMTTSGVIRDVSQQALKLFAPVSPAIFRDSICISLYMSRIIQNTSTSSQR